MRKISFRLFCGGCEELDTGGKLVTKTRRTAYCRIPRRNREIIARKTYTADLSD